MARVYKKKDMLERLSKFDIDPTSNCWNWTGSKDKDGYGRMISGLNGKRVFSFAHRESYKFYKGEIGSPDSLESCVLHTCDNPSCINPDHLYLGDAKQNGLDKKNRSRARTKPQIGPNNGMYGRRGEQNPFYGKTHTKESIDKMLETRKLNKLKACK